MAVNPVASKSGQKCSKSVWQAGKAQHAGDGYPEGVRSWAEEEILWAEMVSCRSCPTVGTAARTPGAEEKNSVIQEGEESKQSCLTGQGREQEQMVRGKVV